MKRVIEVIPSFAFILVFLYGLYLKALGDPWVDVFAWGLIGTCVYSVVIIFIDGMSISFRYPKPMKLSQKIFYGYFILLAAISIVYAIYLMAHN